MILSVKRNHKAKFLCLIFIFLILTNSNNLKIVLLFKVKDKLKNLKKEEKRERGYKAGKLFEL